MRIKRVLHASDFSKASRPAFQLARDLAKAFKAQLVLFYAYEPPPRVMGEGYVPPALLQKMRAAERKAAERKLARLMRSATRDRIRVLTLLEEGRAAEAIVRAARRKRASLIVLGTRGRTGVARLLLGSVAERVVRTAHCPVLTVGVGKG
ncbi:MAG: universal stress protein [Candidatus Methylomirabilales bacterium]